MAFIVVMTMFLIATPFDVVADCSVAGKIVKDCQWNDWSLNCEQCCWNMDAKVAFKSRKTCCQDILSSEECSAKCGVESLLESAFDDCRVHCEDICKGLGEKPVDESADSYLANSILNPVLSRHLLAADTSQDDLEDCEEENSKSKHIYVVKLVHGLSEKVLKLSF